MVKPMRLERFRHRVLDIAKRLGHKAGIEAVNEEGCAAAGLMGKYAYMNLGLADMEPQFVQRLHETLERTFGYNSREQRELEQEAWREWMYARNASIKRLCPGAREYGDE